VDENYLKNLEVPLLAGKHFEPNIPRQVILNETALSEFGFEHPIDAIGEKIFMDDSTDLSIVGVVKDFHFRPLSYKVGPLAFRYDLPDVQIMNIRVAKSNLDMTMGQVEAIWKKLDIHPFDWRTMESEIDGAYEDAGFFDVLGIVGYITIVAITLACLGMLGMAMYATQTRIKEVGVRKVMGASVTDILFLLSKSFAYLILAAVILGVPISLFLGNQFLTMYAYRITITPWLIGSGVLFLVGLGLITIGSQTLRAAVTNPVNSLRYE
jgi:putative ABC transport system permease protein